VKPLLIIDGDSFAHRYYHALPKSIRRKDGGAGNLLDGVGGLLVRLWEEERPRAALVAWDTLTVPTYRHEALAAYQSGRVFDEELLDQLDLAPQLVESMGFAAAKAAGYEADDFLAAGVAFEEGRGGTALVASGDRDTFQLASERTTILQPQKGGGPLARIGPAGVRERYGVEPEQVPDFIALRGDPSDKIPGARGVGAKTAASLLAQYGSLEAALAEGRFAAEAEALRLYRHVATMDREAPLPSLEDQEPTWSRAAALADEWGLGRLAGRLEVPSSS
jgi:DNA polymerase-1